MNWFFKRFSEPSTYAGLALLAQNVAVVAATKGADVQALAGVIGGLAAIVAPEKGATNGG